MSVKLRLRTLKNGDKSAMLDIYHNGERNYEFLKIYIRKKDSSDTKKEKKLLAENIRNKRELELSSNDYDFIPSFKKKVDFISYFQHYLENYTKKDIRKVRYALEKFKVFIKVRKISFQKITPTLCEEFKDFLISPDSGLSGETPYDYWKRFKGVIKQAKTEGILIKNPCEDITFKGYQKFNTQLRKQVLTADELQLLAKEDCGNKEVKRAFIFACFTGLGIAEIRKLKWSKIVNGKIKIYREKNGQQIINDLPEAAINVLGEPLTPEENIFALPSDVAISKNLKRWIAKTGIEKNISFYCGRHTFACLLLMNGANLKTVADCLGHSSTRHTLKYLNYVDDLKTDAIKNLPSLQF